MAPTTTVHDLRYRFPRVRKLVETEGEVLVTDRGAPKYRLTLYAPVRPAKMPPTKDYLARLRRYQPHAIGTVTANTLHAKNRGEH
jgi:hypothetical protein